MKIRPSSETVQLSASIGPIGGIVAERDQAFDECAITASVLASRLVPGSVERMSALSRGAQQGLRAGLRRHRQRGQREANRHASEGRRRRIRTPSPQPTARRARPVDDFERVSRELAVECRQRRDLHHPARRLHQDHRHRGAEIVAGVLRGGRHTDQGSAKSSNSAA